MEWTRYQTPKTPKVLLTGTSRLKRGPCKQGSRKKSYVVVKFEDRLFHLSTGIVKIKAICNFLVMCTSAIPKPFSSDYKSHQSSLLFRQSIGICQGKIMNFLFGILILVLAVQGEADAEDQVNATLLRKLQEFMDIPRIVDQFPHRATLQKSGTNQSYVRLRFAPLLWLETS